MRYYDTRYLVIPLVVFSTSFADSEANNSSFMMDELKLLFLFLLMSVFLLTSIHIKLFCCSNRHFELRFGRSAISIPLTLSLITTLFLPSPAFWNAYLAIFFMSFWSDPLNSFFISFDHTEERRLDLSLVHPQQDSTQLLHLSIQHATIDMEASNVDAQET